MIRELTYFKEHYDRSMRKMFAAVSDLYASYWGDYFHFAIFDYDGQSWEEAFQATHAKYMESIGLSRARKVIELACGRGGFSNLLAQNTQGSVLGVDISPTQLRHAGRFRRNNLRFKRYDIMHIDELGETFDAVVFMDAACYLPDKAEAVRKIGAIMNPGARLLLIDWCKRDGLNRLQEELVLHPFMRYWAVPGLETVESYETYFRDECLRLLDVEDLTPKVRRNWDHGYERAVQAVRELSFRDVVGLARTGLRVGPTGLQLIKEQFPAAMYIKAGFDAGFLRYAYFLVEKPG